MVFVTRLFIEELTSGLRSGRLLLVDCLLADETKQRLRMTLGKRVLVGHSAQAPHVCVSQRVLTALWPDGRSFHFKYITMPKAMLSTCGGALHSVFVVLGGIGSHHVYLKCLNAMHDAGIDLLKIRVMDAASGNIRFLHHEALQDEADDSCFNISKHCGQHSNNLALGAVSTGCFNKLPERLYCAAKFMSSGGYFLRMLLQVSALTNAMVVRDTNPMNRPHPLWSRAASGLCSLLCMAHVVGVLDEASGQCRHRKGTPRRTYYDDLVELFKMFNGGLGANKDGWHHYCDGCCSNLEECQRKFRTVVLKVILRRRPPPPMLSRWTSAGVSLDHFCLSIITGVAWSGRRDDAVHVTPCGAQRSLWSLRVCGGHWQ